MRRRAYLKASLGMACLPAWAQHASPRLVSLNGSITELLWRLGAQHLVVGTDTTSTFPAEARLAPKVGYMRQLSAEGVLSLRPTALLGTDEVGPPAVLSQLRQAGVAMMLVHADHTVDELMAKVALAGRASGHVEQARSLQKDVAEQIGAVQALVMRQATLRQARGHAAPRVLFVMCHGGRPQSAGLGTAAHAMLLMAGATPAMQVHKGYQALSAEAVAQARPDIIVTTDDSIQASGGRHAFWRHPGLSLTPAAKGHRLVSMDAMALLGFGPRLPEVLKALHEALA